MHLIGCPNIGEIVQNRTCVCAITGETVQNGTCAFPTNQVVQDVTNASKSNCSFAYYL